MIRVRMTRRGIMDRMRGRCAISRGDGLRASQMERRFAGYFGAETKPDSAVTASFVGHRAHCVALGMIAGSAAWTTGQSGAGNRDDAHSFNLAVRSAVPLSSGLASDSD
jgi:hypothetical protein